jgi:hypothetical protein
MTSRSSHEHHMRGRSQPRRRTVSSAVLVGVVAAVLAACATGGQQAESEAPGQVANTQAPPPPSATPSATAACPVADAQQAPTGCVPYDGELAMRANEAYRQRSELPKNLEARVRTHQLRITVALQKAINAGAVDQPGAVRVLVPLGYDASLVQGYGRSDLPGGFAIGVATDAGCVFGGVRGKAVVLETGGGIADGGCLPAQGH